MKPMKSQWVEVRGTDGRLLFKFHPAKNIIEQKSGQRIYTFDLDERTVSERPADPAVKQRRNNLGRVAY